MKRFLVVMSLMVLFIAGVSMQVHGSSKKPKTKKVNTEKVAKYQKEAKVFLQDAEKAEKAGQKELAQIYRDCAQCEQTIASYYSGEADKAQYKEAKKQFREAESKLKKALRESKKTAGANSKKSADSKKTDDGKRNNVSGKAAKYQKQAEDLKKIADKQRAKGNNEDAAYYDKLAAAKLKLAEAYKSNDRNAVKKAEEEYENVKKAER